MSFSDNKCKMIRTLSFVIAVLFILIFTIFRNTTLLEKQKVFIPFKAIFTLCSVGWGGHGKYIAWGLLANILLFIPLGFALFQNNRERWKIIIPFLISLTVETIQYYTRLGTFEVDDLICNTLGGLLGYELGKQISGQRKGNFIIPSIYLAALGLCCLKSILFN